MSVYFLQATAGGPVIVRTITDFDGKRITEDMRLEDLLARCRNTGKILGESEVEDGEPYGWAFARFEERFDRLNAGSGPAKYVAMIKEAYIEGFNSAYGGEGGKT